MHKFTQKSESDENRVDRVFTAQARAAQGASEQREHQNTSSELSHKHLWFQILLQRGKQYQNNCFNRLYDTAD